MPPSAPRGDYEFGELPHVIIHVAGSEGSNPPLLAISSFLYDLNLVLEVVRLATDRVYDDYAFSAATFYANGRPVKAADRLRVVHLGVGSPFDLVTATLAVPAAAGAIFALTKALAQMAGIPLDWQKTRAEIAKLKAQTRHIDAMTSKASYEVTALDEASRGRPRTPQLASLRVGRVSSTAPHSTGRTLGIRESRASIKPVRTNG